MDTTNFHPGLENPAAVWNRKLKRQVHFRLSRYSEGSFDIGEQLVHLCREGTRFPDGTQIRIYNCTPAANFTAQWAGIEDGSCQGPPSHPKSWLVFMWML